MHCVPNSNSVQQIFQNKIPGIGYVQRFLTSIFGVILEVGIIVIILVYQFLDDKYFKNKKAEQSNHILEIEETDNEKDK